MKVFVAGGSGAMGRRLVPRLVAEGYHVVAMTRDAGKAPWLSAVGAQPVIADALDRAAVRAAVAGAEPEVVIHQLTALGGARDYKRFDREFALTNRLRTEGTDYLLEGARAAGVRRFIAQSYGNWNYAQTGTGLKTEQDPFDATPPANQKQSLAAIRYVESAVTGAEGIEGIALRYGNFYGPGTGFAVDGAIVTRVRKRQFPIVGDGSGVWSFVHMDDAAAAAIAAIGHGGPGVYNVVDDDRIYGAVGCRCWLRPLAPSDRCGCRWAGTAGRRRGRGVTMTQIRGTSNAKAKAELDWAPRYRTSREGFRDGLSEVPVPGFGPLPAGV
jgi:nucleoside-diphosphate-sugar epimerase